MNGSTHPGVNLIGFTQSVNGLGVFARMVADVLIAEGVPLAILPVSLRLTPNAADEDLEPYRTYLQKEPIHPINLFVFGADFGHRWFPQLREPMRVAERYNALIPFWELMEYPDSFLGLRSAMQLFLAPSRFIHHGLLNTLDRTHVDHLPIAALTMPEAAPREEREGRPFRFFYNFDIHSSLDRKHPALLIKAYTELFGDDPGTELIVKVSGMGHSRAGDVLERLRQVGAGARGLRLVTERFSRPGILSLIGESDAYVSSHRSEGLGLGLLEAMTMGVPCIATGYGGNTDFMSRDNSMLMRYRLEDVQCPIYRGLMAGKPARWANPAWQDLTGAMKAVREDAALRARLSANGRRDARRYIDASWNCGLGSLLHAAWRQAGRAGVSPAPSSPTSPRASRAA